MKKSLICLGTLFAASCSVFLSASACEPHWISGISDCGQLIQLENHEAWQVHEMDTHHVLKWKLGEHVVVCDTRAKMKNTDKKEEDQHWVNVKQLSWGQHPPEDNSCELKPPKTQEK